MLMLRVNGGDQVKYMELKLMAVAVMLKGSSRIPE